MREKLDILDPSIEISDYHIVAGDDIFSGFKDRGFDFHFSGVPIPSKMLPVIDDETYDMGPGLRYWLIRKGRNETLYPITVALYKVNDEKGYRTELEIDEQPPLGHATIHYIEQSDGLRFLDITMRGQEIKESVWQAQISHHEFHNWIHNPHHILQRMITEKLSKGDVTNKTNPDGFRPTDWIYYNCKREYNAEKEAYVLVKMPEIPRCEICHEPCHRCHQKHTGRLPS